MLEASSQLQILTRMRKNLGLLYADLAEYFVFDGSKYGIEELFRDIKHFKEQFKKAQKGDFLLEAPKKKKRKSRQHDLALPSTL